MVGVRARRGSFDTGSFENSPHDRASVSALHEGSIPIGASSKLLDVTTLWPWVVYPKSCFGRTRRDDERDEQNRITLAIVPRKQRFVVTFKEALARLVDGLVTLMVIESYGT